MKRKAFELMKALLLDKEMINRSNTNRQVELAIQLYSSIAEMDNEEVKADIQRYRDLLPQSFINDEDYEKHLKAYETLLEVLFLTFDKKNQ